MASICSSGDVGSGRQGGWLAVSCGNEVLIASETREHVAAEAVAESGVLRLSVDHSPLTCTTFSPSNLLLAASSDEKKLKVWKTDGWKILLERDIPKRATSLQFTNDDQYILISDKAGDLHRYPLSDSAHPGDHLLGHFSMLLDMVLSPSNSHVITCDRDEKIRVSKYPNSYNIETYCLAHTDFITKVCLSQSWPNLLLSASGDGTLKCWEWENGKLLDTATCSTTDPPCPEPKVLTQLCCSRSCDSDGRSKVIVAMEEYCNLFSFDLSSDGRLTRCDDGDIALPAPLWSCAFDWSDRLWVCLPHQPKPLLCYYVAGSKLRKVEESRILKSLCSWELLKGAEGQEKNWSQLRKQVFDNMSSYLARKEERLRSKVAVDESSGLEEQEILREPPDKKIKVDDH